MTTISFAQIKQLSRDPIDQYAQAFQATNVEAILDKYGVSASPLRVAHFVAQLLEETGALRALVENMNYTVPQLMKVWPKRFPTPELAAQYQHDPEKLGNFVYANRMGNGDPASGDGYKYRGRGLLQITGKEAYARFGKQLGVDLLANPDLAFSAEHCLEIAAAEWAVSGYKGRFCNELADADDIVGITRAVNGGLTNLDARIAWLKLCKKVLSVAPPEFASRAAAFEAQASDDDSGVVPPYVKRPTSAILRPGLASAAAARDAVAAENICKPYVKRPDQGLKPRAATDVGPWDIADLCAAYDWPKGLPGGGKIAIVELDGGYTDADMSQFFSRIGQPNPTIADVSIDGAKNRPNLHIGEEADPDLEVTLDIQVAAAAYYLATGKPAAIRVYWAPNRPGAIAKAVRKALADGCCACSISWGADEAIWKGWATSDVDYVQDMEDAARAAADGGMIVFAASGDNDASDGGSSPANVDVPSSCPSVIGCGGTTKTRRAERVWNNDPGQPNGHGTGGGYSDYFAPPPWQSIAPQINQSPPRRMVPDVAANADPNTGYNIVVHGSYAPLGGTSAVAPFYAGLFAAFGPNLKDVGQTLWGHEDCFTDITEGENGLYDALPGPDPCSGLGVPIGSRLAALFAPQSGVAAGQGAALAAAGAPAFAPAPFDPKTAIEYGLFVIAAYSMYNKDRSNLTPDPTADFPSGYRLAAWVQMNDFLVFSTGPTLYGFLAQSVSDPSQFVLALRGTQTPEELWDDLVSILKLPFSVDGAGQVAAGFDRIYQTMEIVERPSGAPGAATTARSLRRAGGFSKQVASLVNRLTAAAPRAGGAPPAGASITVIGHSLGSALATLYTMENAHNDKLRHPTLCTFASPRVGDANFVKAFSALPLTSWRIVNARDVVPTLPWEWAGFEHVEVAETYDSTGKTVESLGCWHAMATYLSLIDPSRQPDPACRPAAAAAAVGAPAPRAAELAAPAAAPVVADGSAIANLIKIASDPARLRAAQAEAGQRLLAYDGEQFPRDGCAITLSVLLQWADIGVADTFQAFLLGQTLERRGWRRVDVGSQRPGDVGSTCGAAPQHGVDHIYLVLRTVDSDEMIIADNQAQAPHSRLASGGARSPTRYFLRAPGGQG